LKFPTREDIVKANLRHIQENGGDWNGPENTINPGSLEWVLEAIGYPLFDVEMYPSLAEKAAILAWTIIDSHVFLDGCKRTGMSVMEAFLISNGYGLNATGNEIKDVAIRIASRVEVGYSFEEFCEWVRQRTNTDGPMFVRAVLLHMAEQTAGPS